MEYSAPAATSHPHFFVPTSPFPPQFYPPSSFHPTGDYGPTQPPSRGRSAAIALTSYHPIKIIPRVSALHMAIVPGSIRKNPLTSRTLRIPLNRLHILKNSGGSAVTSLNLSSAPLDQVFHASSAPRGGTKVVWKSRHVFPPAPLGGAGAPWCARTASGLWIWARPHSLRMTQNWRSLLLKGVCPGR